jgi:tRNA U34 2-thiouridine synthase MnmA/TrmU
MSEKKAAVLFSGGLDSRLAVKLLQEQGSEVECLFFKFPFGSGCCNQNCAFNFSQMNGVKMIIFDCTKGKLFQEYLDIIKHPKFSRGKGMNPCIDCRIFMLKKAKEYADKSKIEIIATGEVLGERPLSQHKKALDIIEQESGLKGRLLRPLSAKLLEETKAEKEKILDREKLFDIQGRQRNKQIQLAEKYNLVYPSPGGGCLLCEQDFAKKLKDLIKYKPKITETDIELLKVGRHFRVKGKIIIGRNEKENKLIGSLIKNKENFIIPEEFPGPTIYFENKEDKAIAEEMLKAYSKNGKGRENFEKYRI